jgi:hypothetical protein
MSKTVNLLEYLNELEIIDTVPSEVRTRCPICGTGKLKISRRTGMGKCFTSSCDIRDILAAVGAPTFVHNKPHYTYVEPVELPSTPISLYNTVGHESTAIYHPPKFSNTYGEKVQEVDYIFDQYHKVYRINLLISKSKNNFPNKFNPKHSRWEINPAETFPFYNERFIMANQNRNNFVLVVEGEKNAEIVSCNTDVLAITPPLGFGWSRYWLSPNIKRLSKYVGGFVVIPDNDDIGRKKAKTFQMICFANYMPCKIIDLSMLYKEKNDDLVDLHERGWDINKIIKTFTLL